MLQLGLAGGALVVAALLALGLYGAHQLTRPPRSLVEDSAERWGLPEPERVHFEAQDGVRISALWFHDPEAVGSVIVSHGHGANKITNLWLVADLFPRFNVLLPDLRGHGESGGNRTTVGFLERLDVLGAVAWLGEQAGALPIGLHGISMGAAASIIAAAECPSVVAVVADSPFARLSSPVGEAICQRGYPRSISPLLAWSVCTTAGWLVPMGRNRRWLDPIDVVHRIAPRPMLFIHGQADELTPVDNSRRLYERAGEPKELWVVPEVAHAGVAAMEPRAYADRTRAFFERWMAPTPSFTSDPES
jgi:uncharacterized protein